MAQISSSGATPDYEKLGTFYLGKEYDLAGKTRRASMLLYDSKDCVTHAVCVGMTGSGKTGLCIGLLEEAAIDGIPAIVIDPKGDLGNLLLTFPQLRPEDFRPWINEDDARTKGLTPDAFAASQAEKWAKGLGEWGQDGARVQRLKDAADFSIYTPGSNAGRSVSVLKSFDAPGDAVIEDAELFHDRVSGTVTSLLGLLGIQADPLQSREHILLSAIFGAAWGAGKSLDVPGLIQQIQQPPFTKLGVMELESVYPAKERFGLAMALNNLVASPGFSRWVEGEPLDIQAMLYTPEGKPRVSVFSISHLPDAERMFFVSLLLNQVLGWVRQQSGTTSLRALVYMDEIAGYFPPVANPPSKQPLLTLMKQARAFGVGVVLATQNPVDIDYKGLANAGTWFIGRLQTDRDKQRVLDGLEGAAANASVSLDRAEMDRMLSQLGPRVFLMNNVHEDHPVVFETRWCLSYLRGPLTREQIKVLNGANRAPRVGDGVEVVPQNSSAATMKPSVRVNASNARVSVAAGEPPARSGSSTRPVLPPEISQYFLPARTTAAVTYHPMVLGTAKVFFADAKSGIDEEVPVNLVVPIESGPIAVDWEKAEATDLTEADIEKEPVEGSGFASLPPDGGKAKSYDVWKKGFADALYRSQSLEALKSSALGMVSNPKESERDFRARLAQAAREERDAAVEKLRQKFAPKTAAISDRIRRAEQAVAVQKEQSTSAKIGAALSFGTAILGAFLGRKAVSAGNISKASTAARSASRTMKESSDVGRAEENVDSLKRQLAELEGQFQGEVDTLTAKLDPTTEELQKITLKPKKTGISVRAVVLAWAPRTADGAAAW